MYDPSLELRHRLAVDRMSALRRCGESSPAGRPRRSLAAWLVRLAARGSNDRSDGLERQQQSTGTHDPRRSAVTKWR